VKRQTAGRSVVQETNLLASLDPKARDDLRRVLIRDQADRDIGAPSRTADLLT
jgi:hypothetical protein